MLIPTLIMVVVALTLVGVGYFRGDGRHIAGLAIGVRMIIQLLPLLFAAFVVAGMVQVLVPHEVLSRWLGSESGLRGVLIGAVAGGLAPGGPYVSLPIAAALVRSGAGIGTMVSFITAWSLWAVARLPLEIGILGWRLTMIRVVCTFFFPPLAGILAHVLFQTARTG